MGNLDAAALVLGKWLREDSLALLYLCSGHCLRAREQPPAMNIWVLPGGLCICQHLSE